MLKMLKKNIDAGKWYRVKKMLKVNRFKQARKTEERKKLKELKKEFVKI